ncbi:MAG: hypothetical protein ACI9N3_000544 [Colwellia sp.]|jgi:hypothetical protein
MDPFSTVLLPINMTEKYDFIFTIGVGIMKLMVGVNVDRRNFYSQRIGWGSVAPKDKLS